MNEQVSFFEQKLNFEMDPSDLHDAMMKGERLMVIDARSKESFDNEHIRGAVNIHHRSMSPETTAHLDKNLLYVTYCTGIGCNASTKGALKMSRLGFKVKELVGGIDWWKRENYETEGMHTHAGKKVYCDCEN